MTHGSWVTEHTGIALTVDPAEPSLASLGAPVLLGLRRNAKRHHLLVSTLLGKHIPQPVGRILGAGTQLGERVRAAVGGDEIVVLGFAETATGLGHAVAAAVASPYVHTTRRRDGQPTLDFLEEHSHAPDQTITANGRCIVEKPGVMVLVDDELTTGRTSLNAIRTVHAVAPRQRYVVATLLDTMTEQNHADLHVGVAELGASVEVVSLFTGRVTVPETVPTFLDRELPRAPAMPAAIVEHRSELRFATGRDGWGPGTEQTAREWAAKMAAAVGAGATERTLVLGDEELMYVPQLLAATIGADVHSSTTTRSPVIVIDEPGYPIRTSARFSATDDAERSAYAHNLPRSLDHPAAYDDIVFVTDQPAVRPDLLDALTDAAAQTVHVVTIAENR